MREREREWGIERKREREREVGIERKREIDGDDDRGREQDR
jgi:hypothetical protein